MKPRPTTMIRGLLTGLLALVLLAAAAPRAGAEDNGVGRTPLMGWTSWDFLRHDPTEAGVEAQAHALVSDGLARVGYRYVNVDDGWYVCPGPQGPAVDGHGRWVPNPTAFPPVNGVNGIKATAAYVHHLGLKFGIYVTPGISSQAVAENSPIAGTDDTAREIATATPEHNYNCGGMVGIDYARPGAQAFIDSWADELAAWGVDYVKLDGVGRFDVPDVEAWSRALRQTHRPIHLELSNSLNIHAASTWRTYSNGWRTGGDIDCYCSPTSYPLTDWSNVATRFDAVADWAPYGGPGAFNDYDSIDVGNGAALDGLTAAESRSELSLWALGAAPLILGSDLTDLTAQDRGYLLNRSVIAIDQDAIDARRIVDTAHAQVFAKRERSGDAVVGLFNLGSSPEQIAITPAALGLGAAPRYRVQNVWSRASDDVVGTIEEEVPSHGVALLRVTPAPASARLAPLTALAIAGPGTVSGGDGFAERVTFTDEGAQPVPGVRLTLTVPPGLRVSPAAVTVGTVTAARPVSAVFHVSAQVPTRPFTEATVTAHAIRAGGRAATTDSPAVVDVTGPAVRAPLQTYSSATDAPARFAQVGDAFGIEGAGANLFSGADDYSAIDDPGAVGPDATVSVELTGERDLAGYAKAGLMIRDDIRGAGQAPEGVILADSPSGGVQLEYDDDDGRYLDAATPANGSLMVAPPLYLRLVRAGSTYTGAYSTDGSTWEPVGSVTVPGQASTQDAGMFELSHQPGIPGTATFENFSVG